MKKTILLLFIGCLGYSVIHTQSPAVLTVRKYGQQQANSIISEFVAFLSLPNVASDTLNIQKNAAFIMDIMHKKGIQQVQLLRFVLS